MNNNSTRSNLINMFAINFKVGGEFGWASVRGNSSYLRDHTRFAAKVIFGAKLAGADEGLAIFGPNRVGVGDADGFVEAGYVEI